MDKEKIIQKKLKKMLRITTESLGFSFLYVFFHFEPGFNSSVNVIFIEREEYELLNHYALNWCLRTVPCGSLTIRNTSSTVISPSLLKIICL